MFRWQSASYRLARDIGDYLTSEEQARFVEVTWPEASSFAARAREEGLSLRWIGLDQVESERLEGWDILYEVNEQQGVLRRIQSEEGRVLMAKYEELE